MMQALCIAMDEAVLVTHHRQGAWRVQEALADVSSQDITTDPVRSERIYLATLNRGLWHSPDAGATWQPLGQGVLPHKITAIAVSALERSGDGGVIYAGAEPSAVHRSEDGGKSWQELSGFQELPSKESWSFPPRPHTHHVRRITCDPHDAGRVYVCVEAGALVHTPDGGNTWRDRVADGPYDTHTLVAHPHAPGRLYSAAGDGYFESRDGGATWAQPEAGLRHHYLVGLAVDPGDPEAVLVSAAISPHRAYDSRDAESYVYRKVAGETWQPVGANLPDPRGAIATTFTTIAEAPGLFYAANNHGAFHSVDAGLTWEPLGPTWPQAFTTQRTHGMVVIQAS